MECTVRSIIDHLEIVFIKNPINIQLYHVEKLKRIMKSHFILFLLLSLSLSNMNAQQNNLNKEDSKTAMEGLPNLELNVPKGLSYAKFPDLNYQSEALSRLNFSPTIKILVDSNFPIYKPNCNCPIRTYKPDSSFEYYLKIY